MHHKNHRFSTSNHGNPEHHKRPEFPSHPAPSTEKRPGFLNRVREKFKEKPTTKEEVEELGLKAKKETYKTQIYRAKKARPSGLGGILFGGPAPTRPYPRGRQSYRQDDSGSFLFGPSSHGGFGSDSSNFGSGLNDMLGGGGARPPKRGKKERSGFDEMFGLG